MFNKPIFEFFETADSEGQTIIYFRLGERERERQREKYRYFTCSR
jgi:hypothetical protein